MDCKIDEIKIKLTNKLVRMKIDQSYIDDIKDRMKDIELSIDIYVSGSYASGEIRREGEKILSDLDLIVVYADKEELSEIKKKMNEIIGNISSEVKIGVVYCYFYNFIKSKLNDYVLVIDFSSPLVKNIKYIYENMKDMELSPERWKYELQNAVFYLSKYMLVKKDAFLAKTYLSLTKALTYKRALVATNHYILYGEVGKYLQELGENMYFYEQSYGVLCNEIKSYENRIKDKILLHIVDVMLDIFYDDLENEEAIKVYSISYFRETVYNKSFFGMDKNDYYRVIELVIVQNTGMEDISIVSF